MRTFSDVPVVQSEEGGEVGEQLTLNQRVGADDTFSEQKHAYVLTFPWNYPEIITRAQSAYPAPPAYWKAWVPHCRATVEFNQLFREFHQSCALPDKHLLGKCCEGKLAAAVQASVDRIHFHGLDVEMVNLTIDSKITVLKVEIFNGLKVERASNGPSDSYTASQSSILGATSTTYAPVPDNRHFLDCLEVGYSPYLVAVTTMIESPMKLYVQNQNFTSVLFGSQDTEPVKNIVRFEANMTSLDLIDFLPYDNKAPKGWKITDFNDLMNQNPYFD